LATINLNHLFPTPEKPGVKRGPLPKQQLFLKDSLDATKPKYIAYFGGVGSGKTMILCISMLCQGIVHGGTYLICRQFQPELKRTTWRQFLELVPKDLLQEVRVADAEIHVKSVTGKPAIFIFAGLDEPDKLRSLNLSGFAIDEASQVSEEGFLLLQSRLRNSKGLRKGILVGNPAGHNWVYNWFVKKDGFKTPEAAAQYEMIIAPSTENVHLPEGYVQGMLDSYSDERVQREIMGSFDAFEGQVFHEFRRDTHVIKPFDVPQEWTKFVGADHGYRNPACWLWGTVDYDGNVYIYREFYKNEWLIEQICRGNKDTNEPGVVLLNNKEKLEQIRIDPSVKATRGQTGLSDWDTYIDNIPREFPLLLANNEWKPSVDRIKSYLKVDHKTKKPRLFVFDTCVNLIEELTKYRYKDTAANQQATSNVKEEPVKKDDHAVDAFRYLMMTRPDIGVDKSKLKAAPWPTAEGQIQAELNRIRNPQPKDPFGDF
jgi:phage terminase large subunit